MTLPAALLQLSFGKIVQDSLDRMADRGGLREHLVDKLQPRDFERQAKEGFKEILGQLRQPV